jgi:hypothetical protein
MLPHAATLTYTLSWIYLDYTLTSIIVSDNVEKRVSFFQLTHMSR